MSWHREETPWVLIVVRRARRMAECRLCDAAAVITTGWLRGGNVAVVEFCSAHFLRAVARTRSKVERTSIAAMLDGGPQPLHYCGCNDTAVLDHHPSARLAVELGAASRQGPTEAEPKA